MASSVRKPVRDERFVVCVRAEMTADEMEFVDPPGRRGRSRQLFDGGSQRESPVTGGFMGLYIVGTPDTLSKQEFVSSSALGAALLGAYRLEQLGKTGSLPDTPRFPLEEEEKSDVR